LLEVTFPVLTYVLLGLPFDSKDIKRQLERITLADFDFPTVVKGKPARKVAKHAKNLIRAILHPNPTKRPSIDAILKSKWMKNATDSSSDDEFENFTFDKFQLRSVKEH
jgi:serine/threonine protein kinase